MELKDIENTYSGQLFCIIYSGKKENNIEAFFYPSACNITKDNYSIEKSAWLGNI